IRYNAQRRQAAITRQAKIAMLVNTSGGYYWGQNSKLAKKFGVSTATISRDIQALLETHELCDECNKFRQRRGRQIDKYTFYIPNFKVWNSKQYKICL